MKDYRDYVGRGVSIVMTGGASVLGELVKVGQTSLTVKAERLYYDDGEPAPRPSGVIIVEKSAIRFVQVR